MRSRDTITPAKPQSYSAASAPDDDELGQSAGSTPSGDACYQAQMKAYEAWQVGKQQRYAIAREVLAIDERCSDAMLILAEEESAWRKRRKLFERAVAAADRQAREEGWLGAPGTESEEDLNQNWRLRPFLRANLSLANIHAEGGYHREALQQLEKMVSWMPKDGMKLRYEMATLMHLLGDLDGLQALLNRFEGDTRTFFTYERLWLSLVKVVSEEERKRLEEVALQVNNIVPDYLMEKWEHSSKEDLALFESLDLDDTGKESEAAQYAYIARAWWTGRPDTLSWVLQHATSLDEEPEEEHADEQVS